ncbi:hypothetical protein CFC35_00915 [Streptomyces sp. FBKL.4005]|uniref:lanthionine synthetase LanC family protein n=1 Tax=Streptomyces sp. FBKL.4005 TaxID=2015515 RepID=UPI000B9749F9|nr:lanthionine synthetase LanC family protein [Streptomyces sp. FBKL.4005]OYP13233.1 hypothetical protein CFC35_00915 [Streptomyces sp. FBKL.4005]
MCHGWAGTLHTVQCMAADSGDAELRSGAERLAGRVLGGFDPAHPFGYQDKSISPFVADRPGFLQGAAGVALALHTFATGRSPATGWDTALMLN